jgi:KDO2-lipid IV(A) lauroyltransferase
MPEPEKKKLPFGRLIRAYVKRFTYPLMAGFTPAILFVVRILPLGLLRFLALTMGALWYKASAPDRNLGMRNLRRVFGGKISTPDRARVCRESFQNVILQMLELYRLSLLDWDGRMKYLENPDALEKLRAVSAGKGALILTGHVGNWELLFPFISRVKPVSVLARGQKSFDKYVVRTRSAFGVPSIHDWETSSKNLADRICAGEFVCMIYDRNVRKAKGIMVNFLGVPAFTPLHPVNVALFADARVIPAFAIRRPDGRYRLEIFDPMKVVEFSTKAETYRRNIPRLFEPIEKTIRDYPGQWFWANHRWSEPKGVIRGENESNP